MSDEELKEIRDDITKYGEGIVGQHARKLLAEVGKLKREVELLKAKLSKSDSQ